MWVQEWKTHWEFGTGDQIQGPQKGQNGVFEDEKIFDKKKKPGMIDIFLFIIRAAELSLDPFEDHDSVGLLQRIECLQLGIYHDFFYSGKASSDI